MDEEALFKVLGLEADDALRWQILSKLQDLGLVRPNTPLFKMKGSIDWSLWCVELNMSQIAALAAQTRLEIPGQRHAAPDGWRRMKIAGEGSPDPLETWSTGLSMHMVIWVLGLDADEAKRWPRGASLNSAIQVVEMLVRKRFLIAQLPGTPGSQRYFLRTGITPEIILKVLPRIRVLVAAHGVARALE